MAWLEGLSIFNKGICANFILNRKPENISDSCFCGVVEVGG